jgi:hypothetical protein
MRILLLAVMALSTQAAIVDRVEVSVGTRVITLSDIDLRIRLTAFQNREPADFSDKNRHDMAQKLIDQRLIEREMEVGHYPRINAIRLDEMMASFEKSYPDKAAAVAALGKYGLTETDLRLDFGRQADLLTFLSLRFRPGVETADQRLADERQADKDLDAWLDDQRKRTKIDYPDPSFAPGPQPAVRAQ